MERWFSIICTAVLLFGLVFVFGMYSGARQLAPYTLAVEIQRVFSDALNFGGVRPTHWTAPRRFEEDGVSVHVAEQAGDDLVMLQGLFEGSLEIRLIELDGTVVNRWPISPRSLTEGVTHVENRPLVDWNFDTHGAVALPDGSTVFNLDHVALVRLDRCGDLVWRLDELTHHSVDRNEDGTFWVSSTINHFDDGDLPVDLFDPPFAEDTLVHVSAEGEVLQEISLFEVFLQNEELGLLTLGGGVDIPVYDATRPDTERELFHLNDVEALPARMAAAFPGFSEGDLLVSVRNRNLVFVLDPDSLEIKWSSIGNWVRQHDPDWHESGTIRIFDNGQPGGAESEIFRGSRVVEIRPSDNAQRVLLGAGPDPYFHTTRRGKHQQLSGGRILVTESDAGRAFMTNSANEIIWSYSNAFDESYAARISEARAYPREYFDVPDWSCGS